MQILVYFKKNLDIFVSCSGVYSILDNNILLVGQIYLLMGILKYIFVITVDEQLDGYILN